MLGYLWEWSLALHGMSGVGMSGILPLTFTTIADWSRLLDVAVAPHEVEALIEIDRVMSYPPPPEEENN